MTPQALYRIHRIEQREAQLRERYSSSLESRIKEMKRTHEELLKIEDEYQRKNSNGQFKDGV